MAKGSTKVTASMVNDQVIVIMKAKGDAAKALTAVFTSGVAASESKTKAVGAVRLACGGSLNAAGAKAIAAVNADARLSAAAKATAINAIVADPQYPLSKIPLATFRQVRLMIMAADFSRRMGYGAGDNAMAKAIGKLCALNAKSANAKKLPQRNAVEDAAEVNARSELREMVRKANIASPEMRGGQNKTGKAKAIGSRKTATPAKAAPKAATPSNVVEFPVAKVKTVDAIARVVLNVAAHLDAMEKRSASAMTGEIGSIVRQWIVETRAIVARINEASARDDKTASEKAQAKAQAKVEKAKADELARIVMKQG
jgi:hypothetical protein